MQLFKILSLIFFQIIATIGSAEELHLKQLNMQDYYDETKKEKFLTDLYDAITTVGFFSITHTGVDQELTDKAYEMSKDFFHSSKEYKSQFFDSQLNGQRGFVASESAKGASKKDRKEFYHIAREGSYLPNIWPSDSFKSLFEKYYLELSRYSKPLLEAIIASINLHLTQPIDHTKLSSQIDEGDSLLRLIHYPGYDKDLSVDPSTHFWAAAHTDIDYITIIPRATAKGLQVEKNGIWHDVICAEDAFIINIGDMLTNLTNGLLVSSNHRVMADQSQSERFSLVFFVHPDHESPLNPWKEIFSITGGSQKFADGTRKEFLWERLLELGIGGDHLLKEYHQTKHYERQKAYKRESPQVTKLLQSHGLIEKNL